MTHVLIIGSGSVGKRHARNLAALGCTLSCTDPRADRRDELGRETPIRGGYADLSSALKAERFDGVVVGSPTAFHVDQSIEALAAGVPVLLEKPVSIGLAEAQRLQRALADSAGGGRARLLLGYTWRWWPPLQRVRQLLADGAVGRLLHVQFTMAAHLADWHPWEPYRDFFMSSRTLGGGALLDESHWIDLMLWLLGRPTWVWADIGTISGLDIETDDNVDILAGYAGGTRVSLHLDLYGRPHEKSIRFVGEGGTIIWSAAPNRVRIGRGMDQEWQDETFTCERNDMFLAVAREFLDVVGGAAPRTCTIEDGVQAMRLIEAARLSSGSGRRVRLDEV
jgi:predicted dehydrogenase